MKTGVFELIALESYSLEVPSLEVSNSDEDFALSRNFWKGGVGTTVLLP